MKRKTLIILSLLAFSLFVYYVIKGESGIRIDLHQKGESFIEGLKMVHKRNGSNDWVLTAKRADISEDGNTASLSGISMTIKEKGVTLYADKGIYNIADRNLSVDGKVVARGPNYFISSDNGADFNGGAGIVRTKGTVKMEGQKFNVRGNGMNTAEDGRIVRIEGNVKAVFNP